MVQKIVVVLYIYKFNTSYNVRTSRYREKFNLTSIAVTTENYYALRELGKTGDTFNDIISKILKERSLKKEMTSNKQKLLVQ